MSAVTSVAWLGSLWFRTFAKVGLYRRLVLMERRLDEPIPDLPLPADVTVRRLGPDEVEAYAAFRPDQGMAECARRLADGQWCFATWRGGRIISAAWATAGRAWIEYLERGIRLAADEVYSYDLYTAPDARGQGLTPATRMPHLRFLREQGYRRAVATLGPHNQPGRALQGTLGFRCIGRIGYVGIGPWRRYFCRVVPGASGVPPG